jgi:L-serine kinase (ATP) / ParB family transcriptional regulator, heme-responsive regulator
MSELPSLAVAPIEMIRPHEDFDPIRVDRLKNRIDGDGTQLNPMVCTLAPDGSYVLLDGATRREAFKRLGLPHAVVQIVDPATVSLGTWHHVLRDGDRARLVQALQDNPTIKLGPDSGTPRVNVVDSGWRTITPIGVSANASLNSVVGCYHGEFNVTRVTDPAETAVSRTHNDWVAIVEFPALTIEDVMIAATEADFVPAGITRFMVPARALRLNVSLDFLRDPAGTDEKQQRLDELLATRAREGRVRRYDEPVIILDD